MIRLTGNKVAIRPRFDSDRTPSGLLIIPEEAKTRADQGWVKYKGPDVKELEIGDYVIFSGYAGSLVNMEGEGKLIIMPEEFVVFTVTSKVETRMAGIFFQDLDGDYFPATYETLFEMIAAHMKEHPWLRNMDVNVPKPTQEEYEKLRGY
jgi:co-chaperonin GroES (HSP10)